jgi:hypothetical protein
VFFSIQICYVLGPPLSDYLCNINCYFHSNVLTTSENLTRSTLSPSSSSHTATRSRPMTEGGTGTCTRSKSRQERRLSGGRIVFFPRVPPCIWRDVNFN